MIMDLALTTMKQINRNAVENKKGPTDRMPKGCVHEVAHVVDREVLNILPTQVAQLRRARCTANGGTNSG